MKLPLKYIFFLFFMICSLSSLCAQLYDVRITEIVADNDDGIKDEDGDREDWIELCNNGTNSVNLRGWWLTDKYYDPEKWEFPEIILPPGGYIVVWASGKDRDNPLMPLHTNFGLSKGGEYLGLCRPSPVDGTPLLVDEFSPAFPALPPDVSYGVTSVEGIETLVASGDIGRYTVLSNSQGNAYYFGTDYASGHLGHDQPGGWNVSTAFDDSAWIAAETGIGYSSDVEYDPWIGGSPDSNCRDVLRYVNSSLCFRKTFVIDNTNAVVSLTLKMKYEDGFVAFINGVEVGRANCSTNLLAYNTSADTWLNESIVNSWTEYDVPLDILHEGSNILAVQGVNAGASSSDFLLLPELEAVILGGETLGYYSEPTPGEANGVATTGALLYDAEPSDPDIPRPLGDGSSPPLTVTVNVIETLASVSAVRVYTRRMYDAESAPVLMKDDGVAPDQYADDGIYSAQIDTTVVGAGEMLRWRFESEDAEGRITKLPAYIDPLNNAQYYGTVALDPSVATSELNTLYWFVENAPTTGPTWSDFRGCCYYLTNFYDNTGHEIHGQSTSSFPKKSYDFDFTDDDRFLWKDGERRVKDINLLSNYADKTKTRNTLAHWIGSVFGTPYHFCSPVRVHLNAAFHGVMDLMEDSDDRMLERNGLDPEGAYYKIYNSNLITSAEKKTRKDEDNQDLQDLADNLNTSLPLEQRSVYAYDHLDIAAAVNYLAVRQFTTDSDHGHKNMLMYRDTNNTREWQPIIWDVDLSAGHMWTSDEYYFDDEIYYEPPRIPLNRGAQNPVYQMIYYNPEVLKMYLRRLRTMMDELMQPPGTTNGILEAKMLEIVTSVDPDPVHNSGWTDGDLNLAKWGIDSRWDYYNDPRQEVARLAAEYYPQRRDFLFDTGFFRVNIYGEEIPDLPQVNATGMVCICEIENMPQSQLLSEEYIILKNMTPDAVDVSGWTIEGSIAHTLRPGTVIPAGSGLAVDNYVGLLHVVKDAYAFRARSDGPSGGERRFVQGNFQGQLPADGGSLTLRDDSGMMIFTTNYVDSVSPSQQSLRVTEINYHPVGPTEEELAGYPWATDEDFEYVELRNTGAVQINLTGAAFVEGIDYVFPETTLASGERLIIARNLTAFNLRYPGVTVPVFGPFDGALDNSSDCLVLIDAGGDKVLEFEYEDCWYDLTDGSGRALVLRTENIATNLYNDLFQWNVSWNSLGSPGDGEEKEAQAYHGWDNTKFTELELQDELISGLYADPDNDGRVNWIEYALGSEPKSWTTSPPLDMDWITMADGEHIRLSYIHALNAVDVNVNLVYRSDLLSGDWEAPSLQQYYSSTLYPGTRQKLYYRETVPGGAAPRRFYTLQLEYTGDQ